MKNVSEWQRHHLTIEDSFKIVGLLKVCAHQKDLEEGSRVHAYILEHKLFEKNSYLTSTLINMYARCGALAKAQEVLRRQAVRDVTAWNALIAGYVNKGQGEEALKCYDSMVQEGHSANAVTFTSVLKACGTIGAAARGKHIHDKIVSLGMLEKNIVLGNILVDMYARCGELPKAQQVLEELHVRDVVTWTALIAGYAHHGHGEESLRCFDNMQHEGHSPNVVTFICTLKACGSIGAGAKGEQIHNNIVSLGMLEENVILGNTLVDMYARCGALVKAHQVLAELRVRDEVTWNSLISGYVQHGQGEEALKCFDKMQQEGYSPNEATFTCALKACGSIGAAAKGKEIHDKIVSLGLLDKSLELGTTLLDMYARCDDLDRAQQILTELPVRDVVIWTALIAGYVQQDQGEEALKCFDSMQHEGHLPNAVTFTCALKACGSIGKVDKGEKIHEKIVSMGLLDQNIMLGRTLISMYTKCGALAKAQEVLKELPVRDVGTWNALIAGYSQWGQGEEALRCLGDMQHEGHSPDAITFTCALKACGSIGAIARGKQLHDTIVDLGMLERNVVLGNTLLDMYARCGALAKAHEVLVELPVRDVVSWNTLIGGYAQQGHADEALECFDNMLHEGHSPDVVTFTCALKACGSIAAADKGKQIHDKIVSSGMLEKHTVLGTMLVDMYAKCGALEKAQQVFNKLPDRDVVTWNALIAAYVKQGQGEEALKYFDNMQQEGQLPDLVTFICALRACGCTGWGTKGKQIHEKIISLGLENNIVLGNTLVDMYARCGALAKAKQVLRDLPFRDVVTWTALTAGYVQQGQGEEALNCFSSMQLEGHSPDPVIFTCALKACGIVGSATKGKQIHDQVVSLGMLEKNIVLGNTLMDMYAKCAALAKASEVLKELPVQDVVTWNALIGGYAQKGQSVEAFKCFERMQLKGVKPDSTTLICLLNAYSNSGLLDEAEMLFGNMSPIYGITPDLEHYCCMADLFGRAGKLNRALSVIGKMPSADFYPLWASLLGASCKWGDVKIGRIAVDYALQLDKSDAALYVCIGNIC